MSFLGKMFSKLKRSPRPDASTHDQVQDESVLRERESFDSELTSKELETCKSRAFRHLDRISRWEVVNSITHLPVKG